MMWKLNRLRGAKAIWAKYIGAILGLLFGLLSWNPYVGLSIAVLYIGGESMAWGEWIGGMIRWIGTWPVIPASRRDGLKYGISWIALKFSIIDTPDYHATSLFLRGIYWWLPTLAPLYFVLDPFLVTAVIAFIASWFPLSVLLAESSNSHWEDAEIIYGRAQDFGLGLLALALIF